MLVYFDAFGKPGSNGAQLLEALVGFVLLVVGLVLAGPWFTTAGSRLMAKWASRPATLIAGRRLLDNPKAAFRFISGLVIALFIASAAIGALSSIVAAGTSSVGGSPETTTVADLFECFSTWPCPASAQVPSVSSQVLTELRATPGARALTLIHQGPPSTQQREYGFGLVVCAQLAKTPALGKCAPGATVATLGYFLSHLLGHNSRASSTIWSAADFSVANLATPPVDAVVLATNGSPGSVERARTSLERAFPSHGTAVVVLDSLDPSTARLLRMIQDMTGVIIVVSLIIASCSLAVNIAAGLGERKRPFSLLRLMGVPTAVLQRVVALESVLPLFIVAAVAIVVGLVSAGLYLHSQVGVAFRIPGIEYWGIVLGGLAASLAIIGSTFPLLNRITGPGVARNE
jgi:ABC-type antimicrobial peptide transport system permease subunit